MSNEIEDVQKPEIGIEFFFKEKIQTPVFEIERIVTDRIKDAEGRTIPFRFQAISPERMDEIEKISTEKVLKRGKPTGDTNINSKKYSKLVAIESCVFPNLRDAKLLKNYGVNSAEALIEQILPIFGEMQEFISAGLDANKFGYEPEEVMDAAKN